MEQKFFFIYWIASLSSCGWVVILLLHSANTLTVDGEDVDVTSTTPSGAPGVSDDVVLSSFSPPHVGAVSDSVNGVVLACSTLIGINDTTSVLSEDGSVGLEHDGYWALGDGSFQLGDGLVGDVCVFNNTNLTLGGILFADPILTSSRGVWVGGLELLKMILKVIEGA